MEQHIDRLIDLIEQQKSQYDVMLTLSVQKKEAIIKGDASELDAIVEQQASLLEEIIALEQKRKAAAISLANACKISLDDFALTDLPFLTPQQKARIEEIMPAFRKTLEEIDKINEVLTKLLQIHLDYVQHVIYILTETQSMDSYDMNGESEQRREQTKNLLNSIL